MDKMNLTTDMGTMNPPGRQSMNVNSRNHAGVGKGGQPSYNQWFKDTLRTSNATMGQAITTPSRTYRGPATHSIGTPSTIYTTPKHFISQNTDKVTTARSNKQHQQSNRTINDKEATKILENGIKVLGESPMKTIQIDLQPPKGSRGHGETHQRKKKNA